MGDEDLTEFTLPDDAAAYPSISDDELARAEAFLAIKLPLRPEDSPAYRKMVAERKRLRPIVRYNKLVREKRATTPDNDAYVSAREALDACPREFPNYTKLNRYLEKHPRIRRRKPASNRLEIHAADLLRSIADDERRRLAEFA